MSDENNHGKPVTRRQFLAQGAMNGGLILLAPTLTSLLFKNAFAQSLGCADLIVSSGRVPFICVDLAGGSNIAGSNVMVGKQGGQKDFLTDYTGLGLPTTMRPQTGGITLNEEFGLAFHPDSGFLRGMLATTTAATRACVDGAVFCVASNDDTSNNPFNPSFWIAASGTRGGLSALGGSRTTESGGSSVVPPASYDPAFRPVLVSRPSDAVNLVQAGKLVTLLNAEKAAKVGKAIEKLSGSQLTAFSSMDLPTQVRELVRCGYINANSIAEKITPAVINPTLDPAVTQVFTNLANDGNQQKAATAAKLVLDGYLGASTIEMGGYDYHSGNRSDGEARDEAAGRMVGQMLELAKAKNKPLMIYLYTDGSVYSDGTTDDSAAGRGKGVWTGDDGEKGATVLLVLRPSAPRSTSAIVRGNKRQVGWFREGGKIGVDRQATLVSNDVTSLARAVVGNYLALQGEEGRLSQVVGGDTFGSRLDEYLVFNKIT
ncbi:MAG: hypothetical protein JNL01_12975 [Bdellovibrionales bacterium]|nr:hypothetical protein [Bdellovibrionales bacterium]